MLQSPIAIETAVPLNWPDRISLNGRVSAAAAIVTRLGEDERFTDDERRKIDAAAKLLFGTLITVAIRGV